MHFMLVYVHIIFVHRQCFQQLFVRHVCVVDKSNGSNQINHPSTEFSLPYSLVIEIVFY